MQGGAGAAALCRLASAVRAQLGATPAVFFALLSAAQFHTPFYASRTIPNTFAFIPVTLAFAHWLDSTETWLVPVLLVATTIILRCDTLLIAAPVLVILLLQKRVRLGAMIALCCGTAIVSIAATVVIDSVFWGRWLWPELDLFIFNAILGRCVPSPQPVLFACTPCLPLKADECAPLTWP